MQMIRSFLPVGQGAFYTEQFRRIAKQHIGLDSSYMNKYLNVVYDCGADKGIDIVQKTIRSTFHEGEEIYAVFISHIHHDHINGLEYLLKYCRVKNIYLPYLSPDEITISMIANKLQYELSKFEIEFIKNPTQALDKLGYTEDIRVPKIYFVMPDEKQEMYQQDYDDVINNRHPSGNPVMLPTNFLCKDSEMWQYVPYNLHNAGKKAALIHELAQNGLDISQRDAILSELETKQGRNKIRKAYERIFGSSNLNVRTMVLYSGPAQGMQRYRTQSIVTSAYCPSSCHSCCRFACGCLYMGDYNAREEYNYNALEKKFAEYWRHVGIIQLPHHGSQWSFNSKLLQKADYYVISAGRTNRYRHPHVKVLNELIFNGCSFAWVAENVGSCIRTLVHF